MNFRATLFVVLHAHCLTVTLCAAVTIEQLAADEKLWPKEVKLTQTVPLQLYDKGRESGTIQGTVGMTLRVRRVEAGRVTVEIGAAVVVVSPAATDILARVATTVPAMATVHGVQSFRSDWKLSRGEWVVVNDGEIEQRDPKLTVSNASKAIPQSGRMEYRLKQRYVGGKSACTMIYLMCSSGERIQRGDCYLIADALDDKGRAEVSINKVVNDGPRRMKVFPTDAANGGWIDLRITYDATKGLIEITRNGKVLGSWTDADPIKSGTDFSLGTCLTKAGFKDLLVRPLP